MLKNKADYIRKAVVDVCVMNGAGHIAPSLSAIDILVCLYYNILKINESPTWEIRDRLVFSKAHGAYGLYAILSDIGYIPRDEWLNFYKGGTLPGCVERNTNFGIEASCGSLGHGLPIATGIAFGAKKTGKDFSVYCIIGDGEMQEGSNWEAIQFAVKHELNNLVLIVDNNRLQAMDFLDNVLTVKNMNDDLSKKLDAFGFNVYRCNGHVIDDLLENFNSIIRSDNNKPSVLIADTIKGYGLCCMENVPKFHFRIPTEEELNMGKRYE
jgi:transketolase